MFSCVSPVFTSACAKANAPGEVRPPQHRPHVDTLARPGIGDSEEMLFPDPAVRTEARLGRLEAVIQRFASDKGRLPANLDEVVPNASQTPSSLHLDAWQRHIRYTVAAPNFELRSSGVDAVFDTSDDVVIRGVAPP